MFQTIAAIVFIAMMIIFALLALYDQIKEDKEIERELEK